MAAIYVADWYDPRVGVTLTWTTPSQEPFIELLQKDLNPHLQKLT